MSVYSRSSVDSTITKPINLSSDQEPSLVWPTYIAEKSDPVMYENWCQAKLQLHHPYTGDVETLQPVNEDIGCAAYANCVLTCGGADGDPLANEGDLDNENEDEFEEAEEEEIPSRELRDLANRGPEPS